jgi:hypothetical protein
MNEHEHDEPTGAPDAVDARLAATGAQLREGAAPVSGETIVADVLRHDLARARRQNRVVAVAASLLVVALLGATALGFSGRDEQVAGGDGVPTPEQVGDGSAEAIVAALPPEPLDPLDMELVASVSRFDSCEGLLDRLHRVGAAHVGSMGFGGSPIYSPYGPYPAMRAMDESALRLDSAAGAPADGLTSTGGTDGETLGTNVIVDGVDEPDTVKATDSIVVELHNSELRVTDTAAQAVVGTLELATPADDEDEISAYPSTLILDGRHAVVFGQESVPADPIEDDPSQSRPAQQYLTLTFVDLADAANPTVTDRVRIEGGLVAVRRVGGEVRMVTSSSLADLPIVAPTTPNSVAPALEQNRLAVAGSSSSDWIPDWDRGEGTDPAALMGCEDVVVPDTFAGVQMTSLVEFDVAGGFEPRATALLAPAEDLTATATDVVIASHVWVDPIDRQEDFSDWRTALHRFEFTDEGRPDYLGSGAVDGSIRDDFSLAVLDGGVVGAVTADVLPWEQRDQADVTVRTLRTDEGAQTLDEVGTLVPVDSGLAVSGLRFLGDRLLVATGLGGNVVSSVDLSDPAAPTNTGDVTLPGTGAYFHPVGETTVMVLGDTFRQQGEQFVPGLHATMLDLSGPPALAGTWAQEWLSSQATSDHHALTWWPSRSLAAFGIQHETREGLSPPWQAPQAMFLAVGDAAPTPNAVTPVEAELGPPCPTDRLFDPETCDGTGPPIVQRFLVVDGVPWLYTSESLERLDPQSFASTGVVALRP